MEVFIYLYTISSLLLAITTIVWRQNKPTKIQPQHRSRDLELLMGVLDKTIDTHVTFHFKMEIEIKKNTKIINSFQTDLGVLTKKILDSLSLDFIHELNYYYTSKYILEYITKTVQLSMMSYMMTNGLGNK